MGREYAKIGNCKLIMTILITLKQVTLLIVALLITNFTYKLLYS